MDRRNLKMDKVNNRTMNAKQMVFQTQDKQSFMIMNRTTLEKLDAPSDNVLDFVHAQRNKVKRQTHLPWNDLPCLSFWVWTKVLATRT